MIVVAGLLLAPAATLPANRIEILRPAAGDEARLCVADGSWCARIAKEEGAPTILELASGSRAVSTELAPASPRGDADAANLALWPRRIVLDGMPLCSAMMRVASCSADISSEKKPTMPPLTVSVWPWRRTANVFMFPTARTAR